LAASTIHTLRVPFIDYGLSHAELDEMSSPRVFKSHLPLKYLPQDVHLKSKVFFSILEIPNFKNALFLILYKKGGLYNEKFKGHRGLYVQNAAQFQNRSLPGQFLRNG
jgi:hypothetical protein